MKETMNSKWVFMVCEGEEERFPFFFFFFLESESIVSEFNFFFPFFSVATQREIQWMGVSFFLVAERS